VIVPSGIYAFILASVLIELTPGPNMTTLAILAAARGRGHGLAAVGGVAFGLLLVGIAASFGLATLIAQSAWVWNGLRWGGALLLLWLAYDGWRGGESSAATAHNLPTPSSARQSDDSRSLLALFLQGLLTNLLNPKAYLFYVAVVPRFIDSSAEWPLAQSLTLTVVYVSIATLIHIAIVLAAARAGNLLQGDRSVTARKLLSALLAVVAIWLLWDTSIAT
jgi:threonine/homoserine/homoserine lactone efflux protein